MGSYAGRLLPPPRKRLAPLTQVWRSTRQLPAILVCKTVGALSRFAKPLGLNGLWFETTAHRHHWMII